jgi:hypothetical protein
VGEYCRQMKGLADSLRDLGEPVADRTLVLNLLRGLSPLYGHLKALIKRSVPSPPFTPCGTSFSSRSSPWRMRRPLLPRLSTALLPAVSRLRGARPLVPRRPGLLPALHPSSRRLLVRLPRPTVVVAPARAAVGVAAPLVVVPPAGVAATHGRPSTTPGLGLSPCGRARPRVPPVPRRRPS